MPVVKPEKYDPPVIHRQDNSPDLWLSGFPVPSPQGNKYDRGHAVILGAEELTGATRLAAMACARIGAGMVSVLAGRSVAIYRASLPPEIMVRRDSCKSLKKVTVVLGGPGGTSKSRLLPFLDRFAEHARVLDTNAIFIARDHRQLNWQGSCVLTPHQGEMDNAFPEIPGTRQDQAYAAAKSVNAIIALKGPQTLICHPDGRMTVNRHASPYLATAGTGDVLAGLITGLIAQKMPTYDACCAAVWLHAEAAMRHGPGLVASDIPAIIPAVLRDLLGDDFTA